MVGTKILTLGAFATLVCARVAPQSNEDFKRILLVRQDNDNDNNDDDDNNPISQSNAACNAAIDATRANANYCSDANIINQLNACLATFSGDDDEDWEETYDDVLEGIGRACGQTARPGNTLTVSTSTGTSATSGSSSTSTGDTTRTTLTPTTTLTTGGPTGTGIIGNNDDDDDDGNNASFTPTTSVTTTISSPTATSTGSQSNNDDDSDDGNNNGSTNAGSMISAGAGAAAFAVIVALGM
ncbi:hypothetical protein PRZ48_013768 [Zasmidium cellare]|uniref:Uncharacterized protein n=1 Tax=Zasmidium cellare TaxID=395010 RepID=A0ABR0E200_ZASCE|nr:hypothetical protein PRZ48_013768 [Zasmidium cellare]